VARAFLDAYRAAHPEDTVDTLDVFAEDLPSFDGLTLQAKYTILHGKEHTEEEAAAWRAVEQQIERFTSADKYAFAVPMWNFGIPYRLKQYIDILVQPSYTFNYDPETGYTGLVTGKPVFVAYARGGEYEGEDAQALDYQTRYLETILGFIGLADIRSVVVQPTLLGGPDTAAERRTAAIERARVIAAEF
jgi:FMN-dependent NADH-azoreductase